MTYTRDRYDIMQFHELDAIDEICAEQLSN
jgi:hypothetical protein